MQKKIFNPIVEDVTLSPEVLEEKALSLVNIGENIKMKFKVLDDSTTEEKYKFDSVREIIKSKCFPKSASTGFRQLKTNKVIPIEVTIFDSNSDVEVKVISALNFVIKSSIYAGGKRWSFRGQSSYLTIVVLSYLLSKVYLANSLDIFLKRNKELKNYLILREIYNYNRLFSNEEQFSMVNDLLRERNMREIKEFEEGSNCYLRWLNEENVFSLSEILYKRSSKKSYYISMDSRELQLKIKLFLEELCKANKVILAEAKNAGEIANDYAKSYETKKNIPLKLKSKMEKNLFLDWFGEGEFDELCDLEKLNVVEKQFQNFKLYQSSIKKRP